jgi:hypothetical protein
MRVIAVITAPALIDRLLNHVRGRAEEDGGRLSEGCAPGKDPLDARAPPAA